MPRSYARKILRTVREEEMGPNYEAYTVRVLTFEDGRGAKHRLRFCQPPCGTDKMLALQQAACVSQVPLRHTAAVHLVRCLRQFMRFVYHQNAVVLQQRLHRLPPVFCVGQ